MDNNLHSPYNSLVREVAITTTETEAKQAVKKNKIVRVLYAIGGTISLALAILGIFVPGLPVTPLALLSAALYAKSSPKMYNWLLNNKFLGPRIRNYQRRKGVTRKGKVGIILLMSAMVLFSSFVVVRHIPLRIVILSFGFIGSVVVWFFVPTAQDEADGNGE